MLQPARKVARGGVGGGCRCVFFGLGMIGR